MSLLLKGVLNLIINGLPSKLKTRKLIVIDLSVLNLIINGLPSKHHQRVRENDRSRFLVLNLIINGLPSKQKIKAMFKAIGEFCFKPYYKWITF